LRFGQVSVLVVLAVLADALGVVRPRFAGVATGVAAAVKLTPLVFVPYYWLSGRRRVAAVATGTFVACTGLAWAVLPYDSVRFWTERIFDTGGLGALATGGNQSLNGALLRLHVAAPVRLAVLATVGTAVVVVALVRASRAWRHGEPLAGAVVVGAAGLVFSPISWTHHQVWLVLAALLPVSARRQWNLAWAAFVAATMVLPVTSVGGVLFGNARLLLAVAVACAVPFVAVRTATRPA
jgi:alpha-1,2-mannosyltransferase